MPAATVAFSSLLPSASFVVAFRLATFTSKRFKADFTNSAFTVLVMSSASRTSDFVKVHTSTGQVKVSSYAKGAILHSSSWAKTKTVADLAA